MGRKKKIQEEPKTEIIEPNNWGAPAVKDSKKENLAYTGAVKVSLRKNNKVIRVNKYKNNGGYPLFQFLALSTCGMYKDAEVLRPRYIQLCYVEPTDPNTGLTPEDIREALSRGLNKEDLRSSRILYKSTPKPDARGSTSNPSFSVALNFVIPFTQLNNSAANPANAIALFYQGYGSSNTFCAFAKFDSSILTGVSDEYNLFIEWTLTYANK